MTTDEMTDDRAWARDGTAVVDGTTGPRHFRGFDPETRSPTSFAARVRLLGGFTTHNPNHSRFAHEPGQYAHRGHRCTGCRWFEVRIYAVSTMSGEENDGDRPLGWYVETVGRSIVPGEVDKFQVRHVSEPRRVVGVLVQRRDDHDEFIPFPSRRALDQAADSDPRLAPAVDALVVFDED